MQQKFMKGAVAATGSELFTEVSQDPTDHPMRAASSLMDIRYIAQHSASVCTCDAISVLLLMFPMFKPEMKNAEYHSPCAGHFRLWNVCV